MTEQEIINIIKKNPNRIEDKKLQTEQSCLIALKRSGMLLKFIDNPSEKIIRAAVFKSPKAIQFVKNQTEDLCELAVRKDPEALQYIKNPSYQIVKTAVSKYGKTIKYIEDQTQELCALAINSFTGFKYIKNQTPELCMSAVLRHPENLKYVKEQTEALCLAAVMKDGSTLKYVKKQTKEICLTAALNRINSVAFIKNKSEDLLIEIAKKNADVLCFIDAKTQTEDICLAAVKSCPHKFYLVANKTAPIEEWAVTLLGSNIRHVNEQNRKLKDIAINQAPESIQYFKSQTKEDVDKAIDINPHAIVYSNKRYKDLILKAIEKDQSVFGAIYWSSPKLLYPIDKDMIKLAVEKNPDNIKYSPSRFKEIDLEMIAVKLKGSTLEHISYNKKTLEVCLAAVKQDGLAINFLPYELTNNIDINMAAVKQNGLALRFIKKQSEQLCLAAVENNKDAFAYVDDNFKNKEICLKAINKNKFNQCFLPKVPFFDEEIALKAIAINCHEMKYADKTLDFCLKAIAVNPFAFTMINEETKEMLDVKDVLKSINESLKDEFMLKSFIYILNKDNGREYSEKPTGFNINNTRVKPIIDFIFDKVISMDHEQLSNIASYKNIFNNNFAEIDDRIKQILEKINLIKLVKDKKDEQITTTNKNKIF